VRLEPFVRRGGTVVRLRRPRRRLSTRGKRNLILSGFATSVVAVYVWAAVGGHWAADAAIAILGITAALCLVLEGPVDRP
jgi:hypothetical protein